MPKIKDVKPHYKVGLAIMPTSTWQIQWFDLHTKNPWKAVQIRVQISIIKYRYDPI